MFNLMMKIMRWDLENATLILNANNYANPRKIVSSLLIILTVIFASWKRLIVEGLNFKELSRVPNSVVSAMTSF